MAEEGRSREELTSWKEIAEFLGVSQRTAQKRESEHGLPVQRLPGVKGRVSARTAELEAWKAALQKHSRQSNVTLLRVWAIGVTALFLVGAGIMLAVYLASGGAGPPARYRLDYDTLIVSDRENREVWRHVFEEPFSLMEYGDQQLQAGHRRTCFKELSEGSGTSLLFIYISVNRETTGTPLICFSKTGQEAWRFVPGKRVSNLKETTSSVYTISDIHVAPLEPGGDPKIVVTSHHLSSDPNQVVILDGFGKVLGEYWHSGHLALMELLDIDSDGVKEILIAGVNNGHKAAALVALDPNRTTGASGQPEGDGLQLQGFEAAQEEAFILFPRTCINRMLYGFNYVSKLTVSEDSVVAVVGEVDEDRSATVIYRFDRRLNLIGHGVSDRLKAIHARLQVEGKLDHDLSDQEIAELKNLRRLK